MDTFLNHNSNAGDPITESNVRCIIHELKKLRQEIEGIKESIRDQGRYHTSVANRKAGKR